MRQRMQPLIAIGIVWLAVSNGAASPRSSNPAESVLGHSMLRFSSTYDHSCQVTDDGAVRCWGANTSGQLGDGTTSFRNQPVAVAGLFSSKAMAVSVGRFHSCALVGSSVQCWGINGSGQLGDGTFATPRLSPVFVSNLNAAVAVAAGENHTCALVVTGAVFCWGPNGEGQLGVPGTSARNLPVQVPDITNAVALAAGEAHTCALLADGTARCWGRGNFGQLGNGNFPVAAPPVMVSGLFNAVKITAGEDHTCALRADGTVWCWGRNNEGALGDGTTAARPVPAQASGLSNIIAVEAGERHTCALTAVGGISCWGLNLDGQIGDGSVGDPHLLPTATVGIDGAVAVAAGRKHTCAVLYEGRASCWGDNAAAQFGNGTQSDSPIPTSVSGSVPTIVAKAIAAGGMHNCAIRASGTMVCWGQNSLGQLGVGNTNQQTSPVNLAANFSRTVAIAAGSFHTCSIRVNGEVRCWGQNDHLQSGQFSGSFLTVPTLVSNIPNAIAIAAGQDHTCALKADGTVACWGSNEFFQLGGTTVQESTHAPVAVSGITNAISIAAGNYHSCALQANGTMSCWGRNIFGQLGIGQVDTLDHAATGVIGISNVVAIAAGTDHTCGVLSDGTARCWGRNTSAQIGDGSFGQPKTVPTTVSSLTAAIAISAGEGHTCAMTPGVVQCWGDNAYGQLGNNNGPFDSFVPVNVISSIRNGVPFPLKGMIQVVSGSLHSCALDQNGGPRCWGNDSEFQLGNDNVKADQAMPVTVTSFTVNIDPSVELSANGRTATVTIIATCEEGQRLHVEVDMIQGAAAGQGIADGECTGVLANYPVTVPAQGKNAFASGAAQVTAQATIRDQGRIVSDQEWTRAVTIGTIP